VGCPASKHLSVVKSAASRFAACCCLCFRHVVLDEPTNHWTPIPSPGMEHFPARTSPAQWWPLPRSLTSLIRRWLDSWMDRGHRHPLRGQKLSQWAGIQGQRWLKRPSRSPHHPSDESRTEWVRPGRQRSSNQSRPACSVLKNCNPRSSRSAANQRDLLSRRPSPGRQVTSSTTSAKGLWRPRFDRRSELCRGPGARLSRVIGR